MKVPQFVIKYANYKYDLISSNDLMQDKFKLEKMRNVTRAVRMVENDRITIDEAMKLISEE